MVTSCAYMKYAQPENEMKRSVVSRGMTDERLLTVSHQHRARFHGDASSDESFSKFVPHLDTCRHNYDDICGDQRDPSNHRHWHRPFSKHAGLSLLREALERTPSNDSQLRHEDNQRRLTVRLP